MKVWYPVLTVFFTVLSQTALFGAEPYEWERSLVSAKGDVLWAGSPSGEPNTVYAGTGEGLYVSLDTGATWEKIEVSPEVKNVSMGAFDGKDIHFIAAGGLYIGKDGAWRRFPALDGLEGVHVLKKETYGNVIVTWTNKELFIVSEGTVKKFGAVSLWKSIDDVVSCGGRVYVISDGDVFISENDENGWKRTGLYPGQVREDAVGSEEETPDDGDEVSPSVRSRISSCGENGLIAATPKGIYSLTLDCEIKDFFNTAGLPANELRFAADTPNGLLVSSRKKLFLYLKENDIWVPVFEPAGEGAINYFFAGPANADGKDIWVAAGASLYRGCPGPSPRGTVCAGSERKKYYFENEPTIKEVQSMAIEYAEVHPKKIEAWRNAAGWKAVMPKLSVDFGEDRSDNVEVYTSATNCYSYIGPEERSDGWDIGLQWDLSDLVWNEAQTSIDVRSKLMVQLRNEVLQEVTRLYFERKRFLAGASPGAGAGKGRGKEDMEHGAWSMEEKEIRIEELTAHIDAFTGGRFSEAIIRRKTQE